MWVLVSCRKYQLKNDGLLKPIVCTGLFKRISIVKLQCIFENLLTADFFKL